jgi:ribonuclease HII
MTKSFPNFCEEDKLKKKGYKLICGIDEAGIGAWAGPLVLGTVILPSSFKKIPLQDSKMLSSKKREKFFKLIKTQAIAWSVGIASELEIDRFGLTCAKQIAFERALKKLKKKPDFLLIDGVRFGKFCLPCKFIIHGDTKVKSIAAASIVAKVFRDKLMKRLHQKYPQYHFDKNKGYGTAEHREALKKYGASVLHRKSYRPIKELGKK